MRQTPAFYSLFSQIVTVKMRYAVDMNILTAFPIRGFLFTILLFVFCLVGVQIALFAQIGWEHQHNTDHAAEKNKQEPPKEEKKPPENKEPIYYIVERKTKRAKASYGEPKQINFKP